MFKQITMKKVAMFIGIFAIMFAITFAETKVYADNEPTPTDITWSYTDADGNKKEDSLSAEQALNGDHDIKPNLFNEDRSGVDDKNQIGNLGQNIVTIIRNVGYAIAGVIILVLGIKYLMGSVEQKAEYKKTMVPYLVGAGLLFGVSTVITVVMGIGEAFTK